MDLTYMYTKFYTFSSINKWNNPIQKNLLKITIFEFLLDIYF